jgi:hypothetical protein
MYKQLSASALLFFAVSNLSTAGQLYQWVDAEGTITYSPNPPNKDLNIKYEEISGKLNTLPLASTKQQHTNTPSFGKIQPALNKKVKARSIKHDKKNFKTVQSAQLSASSPNRDKIRKMRECKSLENRTSTLESRIGAVKSSKQLDQAIILLNQAQKKFDTNCSK